MNKILLMVFFLIGYTSNAQSQFNLSGSPLQTGGVYSLFGIRDCDSFKATDTAYRVVHIDQGNKHILSIKLLLTKPGESVTIQTLDYKVADSTLIPNFPDQVDSSLFHNRSILLINSTNINAENPVEDQLIINDSARTDTTTLADSLFKKIKTNPVKIHGSVTVTGQLSDNKYPYQTVPQNYVRTAVNSNIELFGAPFNVGYLYTTESNTGLNQINNYRVSFDYQKFYNNLKQQVEKKAKANASKQLGQVTDINIEELGKEYSKLKNQLSMPDYQKYLDKNKAILERGEMDTSFKKSYRYKKAQDQMKENDVKLNRLRMIDSLKNKYLEIKKSLDFNNNIDQYKTSTPNGFKRSLKKYGIQKPGYSMLLNLKKLDLGTFDPNYTTLVLSGVSLTGINTEVNAGQLYGAFTWGKSVINFSNPFAMDVSGGRTIMSGRVGVGRTEKMLLAFSVLKGDDEEKNTVSDSNHLYYVPKHNYVTGVDFHYKLDSRIDIGFEYARALNVETGNNQEPVSTQYGSLFKGDKSKYANAWSGFANLYLPQSNTRLRISSRLVDPFYYSFGTPYLRQDNFRLEGKVDKGFFNNQLSAGITYRLDRDNIYGLKEATSYNNTVIAMVQARFKKYPFVILMYSPNYQLFYNSALKQKIASTIKLYQATVGYTKSNKRKVITTTVTYTKQYNESNSEGMTLFHVDQYTLNENVQFLPINLQLNSMISYTLPLSGIDTGKVFVANATASKGIFKKKVIVTGGYAYQQDYIREQRNIIQAGTSFKLYWGISCTIKLERHFIKQYTENGQNSDMHLGRIILIKTF